MGSRFALANDQQIPYPQSYDEMETEYGLALREIVLRLKKEVCDCAADNGGSDRGGAIDKEVAPSPLRHGVAGSDNGAKGQAGDKVVVVEHDGHSIPQGDG